MKRRDFLTASMATALFPVGSNWAGTLAGGLPARALDGSDMILPASHIEALAADMRGKIVLPGTHDYDKARQVWNGIFEKHPAVIARCNGASDVVQVVNFSREHGLLTAIRGGGHSYSGKSSCDGGIVIDLTQMQSVRVNPKQKTVQVAAGTLLGQLDHEAQSFGLVTPAGVISHTGVAGLTLGGGFGRLSRRFGLTCDNLLGADIVTADGDYIRASEVDNSDLFWGLRGGGGNFGVVTSFDYGLHPMDPIVLAGNVSWPMSQARDAMRFFADYSLEISDELYLIGSLLRDREGMPYFNVGVQWSADHADGERALKPLRTFGQSQNDTIGPVSYVKLQSMNDWTQPFGTKYYNKSGFLRELSDDALDLILDVFLGASRPFSLFLTLEGGAIGRVAANATAFPNRDALYWLAISGQWDDPALSEGQIRVMREQWLRLQPLTHGFYTNSAMNESDKRYKSNYGKNFERLTALKNRYDPHNLFRLNANVAPTI
jgi:FAD/FMN-containing dehydrogenase|tara:strand:- start:1131 stop:2600 length:1470 start_codon:yes stop_codon:yes gene_type:complete